MKKINLIIPLAGLMIAGSAVTGMAALASADTTTTTQATTTTQPSGMTRVKPTAMGSITAINGSTLTLNDKRANATYTVDVSNATFTTRQKPTTEGAKPTETTTTLANLKVGDRVGVTGTLSGTSITATAVMTGDGGMGGHGFGDHHGVRGTVSAVSGSTLTVTGQNGTTYTVDASGATTSKVQTIRLSEISVGDSVDVGGTVTGTTVTAKNILDGMPKPAL